MNYDCDLQAANLFERVVRGVSRVITSAPNPNAPVTSANGGTGGGAVLPSALKPRDAALVVLLAILSSLDEWAVPLQVIVLFSPTDIRILLIDCDIALCPGSLLHHNALQTIQLNKITS